MAPQLWPGYGILVVTAVVTAIPVLVLHAVPVLIGSTDLSASHPGLLYVHVSAGMPAIVLGAAAIWVRPRRGSSSRHRWIGRAYLATGTINALAGLALSIAAPHQPPGLYVATGTVALVWLAASAMAYRAVRGRRIAAHRAWMIRSYVVLWTFVGCRLAQQVTLLPGLGTDGITAVVWLNWVVPLFATQVALEWNASGPRRSATRAPHAVGRMNHEPS